MISIVRSLKGEVQNISFQELEHLLNNKYNEDELEGENLYEYFDMDKSDYKVHFDFDKKIPKKDKKKFNEEEYKEKILFHLNEIFGTKTTDYAISEDSRDIMVNNKRYYKVSYHFIMINRKTCNEDFVDKVKDINRYFKERGIPYDTSIYRKGMSKFRIVKCKKDDDKESLLKPLTYVNDLSKHLIQVVDDCHFIVIKDEILRIVRNNVDTKKVILEKVSGYDIKSTKRKEFITYHTIKKGIECPFASRVHKNNHLYLQESKNYLYLKCHSEDCQDKMRVLYKQYSVDKIQFDIRDFNSIRMSDDEDSDYEKKREYFENFYIYLWDTDSINRIKFTKNRQYNFYERELVEAKEKGLRQLKYNFRSKDKEGNDIIKTEIFIKKYLDDNFKKQYKNICFNPDMYKTDEYNLFYGYNYLEILSEDDEINDKDKKDLRFLLKFIKEQVCENDDEIFFYFISHLALIIQNPTFLNHIITVFYSSKEGTGKSSFLKFFSKVIGEAYSYFGGIEKIMDKHSNSSVGRFINVIEELKRNEFTNELKDYSQRDKVPYNEKYKSEVQIDAYVRYFINTNNNDCLFITKNDRRYAIYEFLKIDDEKKINRIDSIYENKKVIYLFGCYLKKFQMRPEQKKRRWWEMNKPNTKAYQLFLYNDNLSSFFKNLYLNKEYFKNIEYTMRTYIKNDILKMRITEFYEYYTNYCLRMNAKPKNKQNFMKAVTSTFKFIEEGVKNGYDIYKFDMKNLNIFLNIEPEYVNHYVETKEEDSDSNSEEEEEENSDSDEKIPIKKSKFFVKKRTKR